SHWHAIHPCTKCRGVAHLNRRRFRSTLLNVVRYALMASSIVLATLAPPLAGGAIAQSAVAAAVAKPVSLPDIAIGSAKAPITITEYASMSCPHCAAFGENVFPMLRSKYIDTGKVRFVFREFPLDIKAAAASMLARCIANEDAEKYFGAVKLLFQQQDQLMARTKVTLKLIGARFGMSEQARGDLRERSGFAR